jgi:sugar phosphate isomerase/epimerase
MDRRAFLLSGVAAAAALPTMGAAQPLPNVKLGVDLFSLNGQGWDAFQLLDYCSKLGAQVVHFSEIRFLGGLEPDHVKKVREHAQKVGVEIEVGMMSICPASRIFDAKAGTAEEQLGRMIETARLAGSKVVRCVLGTSADRTSPELIEGHIANTAKVLRNVRSRAMDANIKIAIENHAGDMQGRELKMLIEEGGKDFVGACIDSGNPVWAMEDPHVTLETLAPYALTSHVRDSLVYKVPEGIGVQWVRMGEGNVGIREWVRKFVQLCPGRNIDLEVIVGGNRVHRIYDDKYWDGYRNVRAAEFVRFLALAEKGTPPPATAAPQMPPRGGAGAQGGPGRGGPDPARAQRQREDLEASFRACVEMLKA